MSRLYVLLIILTIGSSCTTQAQMTARVVKDNLFIPWEILYAPDNKIWFTQKNGYICRVDPVSGTLDTLYHEAAVVIRGEGGMTGMVLHPSFPTQPYVYVAHNYLDGTTYKIRVVRYTYNGTNALSSMQVLLDNINGSYNHNGTRLVASGDKLFIATGDAEVPAVAQNTTAINGKILRINIDGTIPSDNPMAGSPVWSWGHRNAQGLVMANGMLYSSEHGPNNDDEVNIIKKGRNFGWPTVQGFCNTPAEMTFCNDSNVATPLMAWTPTIAVCGMDYYDKAMFPAWQSSLLMTTLKDQHLYVLKLNAAKDSITNASVVAGVSFGRLRDICVAPSGKVYVSTSNSTASGSGTMVDKIVEIYDPSATGVPGISNLQMNVFPNPAKQLLQVELSRLIAGFYQVVDMAGKIAAAGNIINKAFRIEVGNLTNGFYQLVITDNSGSKMVKSITIAK